MPQGQFTTGEVNYLVSSAKLIRGIPRERHLDSGLRKGWLITSEVYRKDDLTKPVKGLVVMAKAHQAPAGLPHPTPSVALMWYGKRIRGLNYELLHDNPDGTGVKGWHEHIWSPHEQDARVIEARPEPHRKQLLDILKWGLKKWNIEVLEEQDELGY